MIKNLLMLAFTGSLTFSLTAQKILHPVIKDYGKVFDVPFAVVKPDPGISYKLVTEVSESIENKAEVDEALEIIARMYNLHIYGGVAQKNLHIAVVLYGAATVAALNNEEYHKRFGVDNPNIKLVDELKNAGIELHVCGQSIMKQEIDAATINPDINIAISAITAITTYQMKGYSLFYY